MCTTPEPLFVVTNVCHGLKFKADRYSTVNVWLGAALTSNPKIPRLQPAFIKLNWLPAVVVKLPPVLPMSGVPARFCPFMTVHQIVRFNGKAPAGAQVNRVLSVDQDCEAGTNCSVSESTRYTIVRLEFMASLKRMISDAEVGTPLAPLLGVVDTMVG